MVKCNPGRGNTIASLFDKLTFLKIFQNIKSFMTYMQLTFSSFKQTRKVQAANCSNITLIQTEQEECLLIYVWFSGSGLTLALITSWRHGRQRGNSFLLSGNLFHNLQPASRASSKESLLELFQPITSKQRHASWIKNLHTLDRSPIPILDRTGSIPI